MALHEQSVGATDEWYTPKYVFDAMNVEFSLDVAYPKQDLDWIPAKQVIRSKSLEQPWHGFVWMNPPFGGRNGLVPWLSKFFAHGHGVALVPVPDRTSAPWWQIFTPMADLTLFVSPKIKFIGIDGRDGSSPAQGTCLFGIGDCGRKALINARNNNLGLLMESSAV